ncbi:hypothetical protein B7463_g10207, partial [Scytalidium lignicola]
MPNYNQSVLEDPNYVAAEWEVEEHIMDSESKPGAKRLFSNRASIQSGEQAVSSPYSGLIDIHTPGDEETPPGKRPRVTDWPLPSTATPNRSNRVPLQSRTAPNSPSNRRLRSQPRPSRFLEGSMNDRASKQPPLNYIGQQEEDIRERHEQEQLGGYTQTRAFKARTTPHHVKSTSDASVESMESARPTSGIFRFGKSLAASFNPSNWKIWSKQPQQSDQETAEQKVLRERRERAEQTYQELKSTGYFRGNNVIQSSVHNQKAKTHSRSKNTSVPIIDRSSSEGPKPSIDISTVEQKSRRAVAPPAFSYSARARSTTSIQSPTRDHLNDSPFPGQYSDAPARSVSGTQGTPSYNTRTRATEYERHKPLRKLPSRKELEKQQKLVKRVSNLEAKLDLARRELARTMRQSHLSQPTQSNTPGFMPSGLATLPSERLLNGYLSPDEAMSDGPGSPEIGKAFTTDQTASTHHSEPFEFQREARQASSNPESVTSNMQDDDIMQSVEMHTEDSTIEQVTRDAFAMADVTNEEGSYRLPAIDDRQSRTRSKKRKGTFEDLGKDSQSFHKKSDSTSQVPPQIRENQKDGGSQKEQGAKLRKSAPESRRTKLDMKHNAANALDLTEDQQSNPNGTSDPTSPPVPRDRDLIEKEPNVPANKPPAKLTKSKIPRKKPSSVLEHKKPRGQPREEALSDNRNKNQVNHTDIISEDIPPVPKIPKAVRLASGEIIRTSNDSSRRITLSMTASERNEKRIQNSQNNDPFEWPEDVF